MIVVRRMTEADMPFGLHLSRQAGWNQTEADWRRLLALQPDGCFVAEWQGAPAGTTATTILGAVAWISMVLVEQTLRGRGIGTALLHHALHVLDQQGLASVRLDATPLGQPLYEQLGFVAEHRLARYHGVLPPAAQVREVEAAAPADWDELAALDEAITGTDRRRLLLALFGERPDAVRCVREGCRPHGYLAWRPGRQAYQLGPCIATPEAAPLLFADACHHLAGQPVFVDVPLANEVAVQLALGLGLSAQRHLTRMGRGIPRCEQIDCFWASSGPEKG